MNQMPTVPGMPPPKQTPPPRGQRIVIFIEDVLIVLSVVFLLCFTIFRLRGPVWTGVMYAALLAMIVVFVVRFRRIKRADKA